MLLVPYLLMLPFGRRVPNAIAALWHRGARRLCGLRLWVSGTPTASPGAVYVANHVSYLDIPVLGGLVDATFVAKRDVAGWPLFGFLARLQRTVFVSRDPRRAGDDCSHLIGRLAEGERLIVFPEGTSSDGRRVLPFRSSIFEAVRRSAAAQAFVQPVSIAYPRYADGRALVGGLQDLYAWHGDMTLFDHLLGVFSHKGALVEVTFHEPVAVDDFADRKALARHCERIVADGVARAHGRRVYLAGGTGRQQWATLFRT